MTKYNKEALDAAEDSVAMVVAASMPTVPVGAIATAVSDSLTRAPWWEEAEVGYEFQDGQPYRCELADGVNGEGSAFGSMSLDPRHKVFRDTRWQPPVKPPKVGDVIEECTDETLPADGVGLVDALGTVAQIFDDTIMWTNRGEDEWSSLLQRHLPITVIYVPKVGDDE